MKLECVLLQYFYRNQREQALNKQRCLILAMTMLNVTRQGEKQHVFKMDIGQETVAIYLTFWDTPQKKKKKKKHIHH